MNILILCESFPPEINSISSLYGELVTELAAQGHNIRVVTRTPRTYLSEDATIETAIANHPRVSVKRIRILPARRTLMPLRLMEQLTTSARMFIEGLRGFKPDAILVYSPPLPYILPAILLKWIRNAPIILNVQDLYPQTAIDLGYFKNPLLRKMSRMLESLAYKSASRIIVHSDGNKNYVVNRGTSEVKISAIPNWIDTEKIQPEGRNNSFSNKHELGDKFVVSFAGVLGLAQGLDVVLKAAEHLKTEPDILFLLVGDGAMKERIEQSVRHLALTNIKLLPMQPPDEYPNILSASDVCLVTLDGRLKTPVVPGKLQAIMAAGRPVLASVAVEGDVPKIINQAGCGVIAEGGNSTELANAILSMMNDKSTLQTMGENGRSYAEHHFAKSEVLAQFTSKLLSVSEDL